MQILQPFVRIPVSVSEERCSMRKFKEDGKDTLHVISIGFAKSWGKKMKKTLILSRWGICVVFVRKSKEASVLNFYDKEVYGMLCR